MKPNNKPRLIWESLYKYQSYWLLIFTGAVMLFSLVLTNNYSMTTDIVLRLVYFSLLLLVLLWYQLFEYDLLTLTHGLYYLLLIVSFNSNVINGDWYAYLPWVVFLVDVVAAVILYLNSYNTKAVYRYFMLHFFSWLCIFSPQPDKIAGMFFLLGLLLRVWPTLINFWWQQCRYVNSILSLALILSGEISIVWDLMKYSQVMKDLLLSSVDILNHNIDVFTVDLDMLKFGMEINITEILYYIGFIFFFYYACKLLNAISVKDIMLYIYQAQLGLLMGFIIQMMYLSDYNLNWYMVVWSNWFRLMVPWLIGVCLMQINQQIASVSNITALSPTKIRPVVSNINHHMANQTNAVGILPGYACTQKLLQQFHSQLFRFVSQTAWLWILVLVLIVGYLSTVSILWYFLFLNSRYLIFSPSLVNNLLMLGLGLISIFTALWWTVCLYQGFTLARTTDWQYRVIYSLGVCLLLGLMIFQWLNIIWLWEGLGIINLYSVSTSYALVSGHLYQWRQVYCVLVGLGLIVLQYFWHWWSLLDTSVNRIGNGFRSITLKIWQVIRYRTSRIRPWIKYLIYVIYRLSYSLVYYLAFWLNNAGHIKPGSAIVAVMVYWSIMLLLCYF